MKQNIMITLIVVAIATAAAGFFAGIKYQQGKQTAAFRQFGNGGLRGQGGQNGTRGGFRPVAGEVMKADETSVTVKLADGSSKIVLFNDKTHVSKAADATKADITTGMTVAVFGTENPDGSITAQNVQLNPQQLRVGSPAPSPTPTVSY